MAASQGTMNNFTFGNDQLPVLRDHLGRLRRRRRLRRHRRGADQHDQFAPDRSRKSSSGASRCGSNSYEIRPGSRRGRALARRQRRRAPGALSGADDGGDPVEQPHPCAVRHGRRRAGRAAAATACERADGTRRARWGISARSTWPPATCSSSRRRAAAVTASPSTGQHIVARPRALYAAPASLFTTNHERNHETCTDLLRPGGGNAADGDRLQARRSPGHAGC